MNKKTKTYIVNGLTLSRVLATFSMPILYTCLSSSMFFLLIGIILLTDCIDGKLARKWDVSTIFGSLADMGADKLLGVAILLILSFSYPIMLLPIAIELGISIVNTKSALKGNIGKSKQIGRLKMWVMGITMTSLLMLGATPEISEYLSNANIDENLFKNVNDFLTKNKNTIENVVIPASIISETATLIDYAKDYKKVKNNEKTKMIAELKKFREFLKDYELKKYIDDVLLNEEYYKKTKDEPLVKKLMPNKNKSVDK